MFDFYTEFKKGSEPMKIEKLNDKQIRCTLNKKDLSDRELRISELAYGTDKAKALFRDMMQQASYEFGFEADNIPLMIEAIPMYPDTLVLLITKVDEPDELDTRFSSFTNDPDDEYYENENEYGYEFEDEYDSNLMDNDYDNETLPFFPSAAKNSDDDFISLSEALGMEPRPKTEYKNKKENTSDIIKIFSFDTLDDVTALSVHLHGIYDGSNVLYKDNKTQKYFLVLHKSRLSADKFNKVCNIVAEYGVQAKNMYASHLYMEEHFEPLIRSKAVQVLASI